MKSLLSLLFTAVAVAEPVRVHVEPDVVRDIGGITAFDREQYITIHESPDSNDLSEADHRYILDELDAHYGRDGGFLSYQAGTVKADPNDPDMPDLADLKRRAKRFRNSLGTRSEQEAAEMRGTILCTHPELMHAMPKNKHAAWGPRTYEGVAEFTAQFLKHYFTDEDRPRTLEVFNEPFVKARKMGVTIEALAEQHNPVAKRVKELNPDVMVGGYSAAWVEVEARNFAHWNNWQRTFMDIAGENMDFFSYHIYDGVNVQGNPRDRTGSNSEAIMDLIDSYSHIKFGVAKPIMITEYGKIPEGNMGTLPYSAERSGNMLYALNGQHMTFMDHPDRLLRVIPFILGKALWTYDLTEDPKPGEANPFLIWRKKADGSFAITDLELFYRFWKGVEGGWRVARSSNPDVRVQVLDDGKRLAVILCDL
ncbi:MAG: beta-agarase, partial [Verrucomicrobiota bacterium]